VSNTFESLLLSYLRSRELSRQLFPEASTSLAAASAGERTAMAELLAYVDGLERKAAALAPFLEEAASIGKLVATQDNRATSDPIFYVQEKVRIYHLEPSAHDDAFVVWFEVDDWNEVDSEKAKELEAEYSDTSEVPEEYYRTGYLDRWDNVQPFFTEAGALEYIRNQGHRHSGELRTYAGSAYANPEWKLARAILQKLGEEP
jgi:hypothetical protein